MRLNKYVISIAYNACHNRGRKAAVHLYDMLWTSPSLSVMHIETRLYLILEIKKRMQIGYFHC